MRGLAIVILWATAHFIRWLVRPRVAEIPMPMRYEGRPKPLLLLRCGYCSTVAKGHTNCRNCGAPPRK